MKIMLVDDDLDLLDVTAYALRREGFAVVLAQDGEQALQRWRREAPDVVVLDLGLPRLDGFQVCQTMRQTTDTPIIMLSGRTDEEQVVQGFRAGSHAFGAALEHLEEALLAGNQPETALRHGVHLVRDWFAQPK